MTFRDLLPHPARLVEVVAESADTRTFVLALEPRVPALEAARPGQFVMLSLLGHGEAAFTLSELPSTAASRGAAIVTVRRVGTFTSVLFALPLGATVGVRGPYGRGFPDEPAEPTVYVAGGCGLSPLKPAFARHLATRPPRTPLALVYGARDPASRIHHGALAAWTGAPDVHVIECVDRGDAQWHGRIGDTVDFIAEALAQTGARHAAVCGPPLMLYRSAESLVHAGLDASNILIAIERYMKCATGHCGHCYVGHRYVCTDGPVFSYAELRALPDAFRAETVAARASGQQSEG